MRTYPPMICKTCNAITPRTSPVQKYCRKCSEDKTAERQRKWAAQHPLSSEQVAKNMRTLQMRREMQGAILNRDETASILWTHQFPEPDLAVHVRVAMPFDYLMSKNALWNIGRGHHVYIRKESALLSIVLQNIIRSASRDRVWKQRKIYLDIFVQKPNNKGDAINVLDFVADAVKKAIGVDDRWFCLRRLDWQIVKENPRLYVGIGQEEGEDQIACSFCGRILTLDNFWKDKAEKMGVSRECKECSRVVSSRKAKRERKAMVRVPIDIPPEVEKIYENMETLP